MENKRMFYRMDFYNLRARFRSRDGEQMDLLVRDLSARGISVYEQERINEQMWFISFELEGEEFGFDGRLLRMEEIGAGRIIHAFEFYDAEEKEQARLTASLIKVERQRLRRRRK